MDCFLDRGRASRIMSLHGIDAVLATTPDNIRYLSGYLPGATTTKTICIVPVDERLPAGLVISAFHADRAAVETTIDDIRTYPTWAMISDLDRLTEESGARARAPAMFSGEDVLAQLRIALADRGLDRGRLGIELGAISLEQFKGIRDALPNATLLDATDLLFEIRRVKSSGEIALLDQACKLADLGVEAMIASDVCGKSISQLKLIYQSAIQNACASSPNIAGLTGLRSFISLGGIISPTAAPCADVAKAGDTLFIDYGVTINGYASDAGRTFAVGRIHPTTGRIMEALEAAYENLLPSVRAGARHCDVFTQGQTAIRNAGFPTYTRGHLGHSIGAGEGEHAPLVSLTETATFEPGMVVSLETPFYVRGLGGHQIEEVLVLGDQSSTILTALPRSLQVI
jgi:Xaa-Pro dipeptidase